MYSFEFSEISFVVIIDFGNTDSSLFMCYQAYAMNERIGYPEFILDRDELDELYEQVSVYVTEI